jgi:hypothetical protein
MEEGDMPDEKDREEEEQADEIAEQKDLNQGMSTGTYDSEKLGVNWPASYRRKLRVPKDESKKQPVGTTPASKAADTK